MARRRLYHTPEEQAEAARRYRHSYYERNRKDVLLKNKERYLHRKSNSRIIVNDVDSESTRCPIKETAKPPAPVKLPVASSRQLTKNKMDNCYKPLDIKSRLTRLLGGHGISLREYLDTICKSLLGQTSNTLDVEDIRSAIDAALKLEKTVHTEEDGVLQRYGVGPKLLHVQSVSKDVRYLLSALEEIFLYILSDITQLQATYDERELMFQVDALI
ncbi:hypothetical protein DEU56DRAFT_758349 [Suillus clintonianus]|uniref:uncharacterized protein n=1 Tax=Suillus clintonianus TaxID=1904413 RepID=UPI001B85C747|nr:uncharacterized protein DEU56DRAFT_758349 [Suillus clintonianus]KAG2128728.1 hypothetical protein DEU56DRAFT_758349 [Suillus clintonianus]